MTSRFRLAPSARRISSRRGRRVALAGAAAIGAVAFAVGSSAGVLSAGQSPKHPPASGISTMSGYTAYTFAYPPKGSNTPDDMMTMGGDLFVGFQNGVGTMGEPSTTTASGNPPKLGQTKSTIAEYPLNGSSSSTTGVKPIATWAITGKCEGLTAVPGKQELAASVNEDGNSSFYLIPATKGSAPQHFTYSPDPASLGGGGSDALTALDGTIYVSGSAPSAANAPALYKVSPDSSSGKANLTPVFADDAAATGPMGSVTLALTDPDSMTVVPSDSTAFAGDIMINSQGDSQLLFVQSPGSPGQAIYQLPIGTQVDDVAWATKSSGMLLMTDNSDNRIIAVTGKFTPGTPYVASPNDAGVQRFLGTLNLATGFMIPIAVGFTNPHGLIFVPGS